VRLESDFFHDEKYSRGIEISGRIFFGQFLNFELIAVSVIKSSVSPAAYPLSNQITIF
jgi:hypothetical protein